MPQGHVEKVPAAKIARNPHQSERERQGVVDYNPSSVREVVIAVAHLLNHVADQSHPGLDEPGHAKRRMTNTAVLVYPRAGGHPNLVGFQLYVTNPTAELIQEGKSSTAGVIFDLRAYEQMGDRYLFNMMESLTQHIRAEHRPSATRLKELSTQFMLAN